MIGIYKIENLVNHKVYIGQSIDIEKRWKQHKRCKKDYPLYKDFSEYGLENFSFVVIEECKKEQLAEREIYWIKYYNSFEQGYNLVCPSLKKESFSNPFTAYPNQLTAVINKKIGERFLMVNINDIREAAKDLSPASLKLYLYFAENQNNYAFHLSPKDFMQSYNVSESTYRRSKEELIRKGYLVQNNKEVIFYANKNDSLQDYEFYKEKINDLIRTLITQGESELELKQLLESKNLKKLEGQEKIIVAKEIVQILKKKIEEKIKNKDFI